MVEDNKGQTGKETVHGSVQVRTQEDRGDHTQVTVTTYIPRKRKKRGSWNSGFSKSSAMVNTIIMEVFPAIMSSVQILKGRENMADGRTSLFFCT
jgi:hypothetical protein